MKIKFAFALNNEEMFEKTHFGEAENFTFYMFNPDKFIRDETFQNPYKSKRTNEDHGSFSKGQAIISFLKEHKVNAIVSHQFGKNIKMVNKHFIPIIIEEENPKQVLKILRNNMEWFKDELGNKNTNFMLFKIKKGVLKSAVE